MIIRKSEVGFIIVTVNHEIKRGPAVSSLPIPILVFCFLIPPWHIELISLETGVDIV